MPPGHLQALGAAGEIGAIEEPKAKAPVKRHRLSTLKPFKSGSPATRKRCSKQPGQAGPLHTL
jgi:hypothetical protein